MNKLNLLTLLLSTLILSPASVRAGGEQGPNPDKPNPEQGPDQDGIVCVGNLVLCDEKAGPEYLEVCLTDAPCVQERLAVDICALSAQHCVPEGLPDLNNCSQEVTALLSCVSK